MKRVYVAGPYSADNVIEVLRNIGRGEKICAELFKRGFAPFCPWHDKSYVIDSYECKFDVEDFYSYSMAWIDVSDAIFLVGDWETSKGTLLEIERAKEIGIPIFYEMKGLIEWANEDQNQSRQAI